MPSTNQIKNQLKTIKRVSKITVEDYLKPKNNESPLPPDLKEYLRFIVSNHLLTCGI